MRTRGASPGGAWYVVGVLAVLLAFSYFDRFILALLADAISQDLDLSDQQMGVLIGFGFALVYSLAGLPIAWYLDHGNRVLGVALGVLVWSACTVASGFAQSFEGLLVLRAGVAIGEAVLTPALVSMVADMFMPEKRGKPTAIYLALGTVMTGGAFVAGGFAVQLAEWLQPAFADLAVWRLTLVIVGLPGTLLVVLLLLTVAEPVRRPDTPSPDGSTVSVNSALAHMRSHAAFYIPFYVCYGFGVSLGFAAFSWVPTILVRSHGFDVSGSGFAFGSVAIPAIVAGTLFWSWLVDRMGYRGAGPTITLLIGVALTLFAALAGLLARDTLVTVVAAALLCAGSGVFTPVFALVVQQATPPRLHARLMAVALLAASIIGSGVGPLAPPVLAPWFGDSPDALRLAVFSYVLVVGVVVIAGLLLGAPGYRRLAQANPAIERAGA